MKLIEYKLEIDKISEYEKEYKQLNQKRYVLNQKIANIDSDLTFLNREINKLQNKSGFFNQRKLENKQKDYRNVKRNYFDLKNEYDDIVFKLNRLENNISLIQKMKEEYSLLFNQKMNECNNPKIKTIIDEMKVIENEILLINEIIELLENSKKICSDIDYEIGKKRYSNAVLHQHSRYGSTIYHSATGGRDDLNEKAIELLDELVLEANRIKTQCTLLNQSFKEVVDRYNKNLNNFEKEIVYEPFKVVEYSMLVIDFKRDLNQLLMSLLEYKKSKEIIIKEMNHKIENIILEE